MSETVLHTRDLPSGMTRDCFDPWTYVEITTAGDVRPCCARPAIGSLLTHPLQQILNGESVRALREQLLTGAPAGQCVKCRLKPPISVAEFQERIALLIDQTEELPDGFDGAAYLAANPDVERAGYDPDRHFVRWGRLEGRRLAP
jgi:hypothetical protein